MTIRFLKPWNGYQPDAVVSGLTNEAALIAGGLASDDLDGGNDGRIYEAKFATDASGNVTGLVGPDGVGYPVPTQRAARVAIMGDSIASQNTSTSATTNHKRLHGYLSWALAFLGQPWEFTAADNFAVAGSTLGVILANQLPALKAAVQAGTRYQRVFISAGTNDTNASRALADIKADYQALFNGIRGLGAIPVCHGILPRGADASLTTAKKLNMQLNEWLAQQAEAGLIEFIDVGESVADNSTAFGNALTTCMYDSGTVNLHPNARGAFLIGKAISAYYKARGIAPGLKVATQAGDVFDRTNNPYGSLYSNPLLQGGTTAPTGMSTSGGTWSKVNRTLDNGQVRTDCQCVLAASTTHYLYDDWVTTGDWASTELQPGDVIEARAIIAVTSGVNINAIYLKHTENDGVTAFDATDLHSADAGLPDGTYELHLKTPPITVRAYGGSGNASIFTRLDVVTAAGASGTAVVKAFEARRIS